ncbi:MAG: SCO family protein [Candidatus Heimdallarchaeota archaeon]|nr:SCO family protein [Candidatus Heimdallarchaeota archaeon]
MTDKLSEIYQFNLKRKKIATVILIAILGSLLIYSAIPAENGDSLTESKDLPYYGQITNFTLTNSNNESYTFSEDSNKIKVVNFFYTKCPGDEGCALVTLRISQLFAKVRQSNYLEQVRFVSIDFDYINDTIADLDPYAKLYTSDTENWQFLIGNKTEIDNLTDEWGYYFAINNQTTSLKLNHGDETHEIDPYDHSFVIYIVDQNSNIRKFLLGASWDINDAFLGIEQLINSMSDV